MSKKILQVVTSATTCPRWVHDRKKEIVIVLLWVCRKSFVRQSYDNRELFGAISQCFMSWNALVTVVSLLYPGRTTVVVTCAFDFDLLVYKSHDSATMLKIPCDCRMTITDDPQFDKNSCCGTA